MADPGDLLKAATAARENAHAPYSAFKVGASVLAEDGAIFAGCNVENVAYPEGTCAEAGALAAMVAARGRSRVSAVLVIADSAIPVTPCGGCRQKLAEFGSADTEVFLANLDGVQAKTRLGDLLPGAFSADHMETASDK